MHTDSGHTYCSQRLDFLWITIALLLGKIEFLRLMYLWTRRQSLDHHLLLNEIMWHLAIDMTWLIKWDASNAIVWNRTKVQFINLVIVAAAFRINLSSISVGLCPQILFLWSFLMNLSAKYVLEKLRQEIKLIPQLRVFLTHLFVHSFVKITERNTVDALKIKQSAILRKMFWI